eukprot:comp22809_c0_seq1/m.35795 comp22809_c0_seq1/g.35795  ORF comp22809_c0_seq1/g.35795 comp22809_c0_seq1/m.35795 type:complete len:223 (-) comp22809_c0_seq1:485-1153(-)
MLRASSRLLRGAVNAAAVGPPLRWRLYSTGPGTVTLVITDPRRFFDGGSVPAPTHPTTPLTRAARDLAKHLDPTPSSTQEDKAVAGEVRLTVPATLVDQIKRGATEEYDDTDPINYFYFGDRGEIFDYTYVGTHSTDSDFTAVLTADSVPSAPLSERWGDFLAKLRADGQRLQSLPGYPFLFVGNLESAYGLQGAAVYTKKARAGQPVQGLLIQSVPDAGDE